MAYGLANHDPQAFEEPDEIVLDRFPNRHAGFGLGVHRCIGSNLARMSFKTMLSVVLERLMDYRLEPDQAVRYEDIGTINGYKHLPATFSPGTRRGSRSTRSLPSGRPHSTPTPLRPEGEYRDAGPHRSRRLPGPYPVRAGGTSDLPSYATKTATPT